MNCNNHARIGHVVEACERVAVMRASLRFATVLRSFKQLFVSHSFARPRFDVKQEQAEQGGGVVLQKCSEAVVCVEGGGM
jgi:hypothetical protein